MHLKYYHPVNNVPNNVTKFGRAPGMHHPLPFPGDNGGVLTIDAAVAGAYAGGQRDD